MLKACTPYGLAMSVCTAIITYCCDMYYQYEHLSISYISIFLAQDLNEQQICEDWIIKKKQFDVLIFYIIAFNLI